jgi:hypothetical protein
LSFDREDDEPLKTGWLESDDSHGRCFYIDYRHDGRPFIFTLTKRGERDKLTVCQCTPHPGGRIAVEHGTVRRKDWQKLVEGAEFGGQLATIADGNQFIMANGPVDLLRFGDGVWDFEVFDVSESTDFPRFWELLRFILGTRLRRRVFEPAYNDLLADHLMTRASRFQTPWARRWIKFCFAARTLRLIVECAAVGLRGTVGQFILPQSIRDAVREWWYGDRN